MADDSKRIAMYEAARKQGLKDSFPAFLGTINTPEGARKVYDKSVRLGLKLPVNTNSFEDFYTDLWGSPPPGKPAPAAAPSVGGQKKSSPASGTGPTSASGDDQVMVQVDGAWTKAPRSTVEQSEGQSFVTGLLEKQAPPPLPQVTYSRGETPTNRRRTNLVAEYMSSNYVPSTQLPSDQMVGNPEADLDAAGRSYDRQISEWAQSRTRPIDAIEEQRNFDRSVISRTQTGPFTPQKMAGSGAQKAAEPKSDPSGLGSLVDGYQKRIDALVLMEEYGLENVVIPGYEDMRGTPYSQWPAEKKRQLVTETSLIKQQINEVSLAQAEARKESGDPFFGMTESERKEAMLNQALDKKYGSEIDEYLSKIGFAKDAEAPDLKLTTQESTAAQAKIQEARDMISDLTAWDPKHAAAIAGLSEKERLDYYVNNIVWPKFKSAFQGYTETEILGMSMGRPFAGGEAEDLEWNQRREGAGKGLGATSDAKIIEEIRSSLPILLASRYGQDPTHYIAKTSGLAQVPRINSILDVPGAWSDMSGQVAMPVLYGLTDPFISMASSITGGSGDAILSENRIRTEMTNSSATNQGWGQFLDTYGFDLDPEQRKHLEEVSAPARGEKLYEGVAASLELAGAFTGVLRGGRVPMKAGRMAFNSEYAGTKLARNSERIFESLAKISSNPENSRFIRLTADLPRRLAVGSGRAIKTGFDYQLVGMVAGNDLNNMGDEANFGSGVVGSIGVGVGRSLLGAPGVVAGIFSRRFATSKAFQALDKAGQAKVTRFLSGGVGEPFEEYAQTVYQIYNEDPEHFNEMHHEMMTGDNLVDFLLVTYIMGLGMRSSSMPTDKRIGRQHLDYNEALLQTASKDQQSKFDEITGRAQFQEAVVEPLAEQTYAEKLTLAGLESATPESAPEAATEAVGEPTVVEVKGANYQVRREGGEFQILSEASGNPVDAKTPVGLAVLKEAREAAIEDMRAAPPIEIKSESAESMMAEVAQESTSPVQIAETFLAASEAEGATQSNQKDVVISEMLRPTTKESFDQFGDPSLREKSAISANYIKKKGDPTDAAASSVQSLDVQAQEISEASGIEVTPQDLVDFMVDNPGGAVRQFTPNQDALRRRFQEVTGFDLDAEFAQRLVGEPQQAGGGVAFYTDAQFAAGTGSSKSRSTKGSPTQQAAETQQAKAKKVETADVEPATDVSEKQAPYAERAIADLVKGLKTSFRYGKSKGAGEYNPRTLQAMTSGGQEPNLGVAAHEIAHAMDDAYSILPGKAKSRELDSELQKFWTMRMASQPRKETPDPMAYRRREGLAEFVRSYTLNPKATTEMAPRLAARFKEAVPADVMAVIEEFGKQTRGFAAMTAEDKISSRIKKEDEYSKLPISSVVKGFFRARKAYRDMIKFVFTDDTAPARDLFKKVLDLDGIKYTDRQVDDPGKVYFRDDFLAMSRSFNSTGGITMKMWTKGFEAWSRKAVIDRETGEQISGKWLLKPLAEVESRERAKELREKTNTYMASERSIEINERAVRQQVEADLKSTTELTVDTKLVPESLVRRFPELLPEGVTVDGYLEWANDAISKTLGALRFQPESRYDFTEMALTGASMGFATEADISIAKTAVKRLTDPSITPESDIKVIKEAARRYRVVADANLRYLVDSGRMSEEKYQETVKNNTYYVSMLRVLEEAPDVGKTLRARGAKGMAESDNVIQRIVGSAKRIEDPYVSLLETTHRIHREAMRNGVMASFVKAFNFDNRAWYDEIPAGLEEIAGAVQRVEFESDADVLVFVAGEQQYWKMDPMIRGSFEASFGAQFIAWFKDPMKDKTVKIPGLHGRDLEAANVALKSIAQLPAFVSIGSAQVLRATITSSPVFGANSIIRETQAAMINSATRENGAQYIRGMAAGLTSILKDVPELTVMEASGASQAGFYSSNKFNHVKIQKSIMNEMFKDDSNIVLDLGKLCVKGPKWFLFGGFSTRADNVPRIAEYKSAYRKFKKEGYDDLEAEFRAAMEARGIMDFAVMGALMRIINPFNPFQNATVQAVLRTYRGMTENPYKWTKAFVSYQVIPTIAYWIMQDMLDDDDRRRQEPAYLRDLFWSFYLSPSQIIRIPKPFEIGVMGASVERTLDYFAAGDEYAFDGYSESLYNSIAGGGWAEGSNIRKIYTALTTGYDEFRGDYFVPPDQRKTDKEILAARQSDRYASPLGKALRDAFGVDSRNVDYFLRAQFGYYGNYAIKISESIAGQGRGLADPALLGFRKDLYTGGRDAMYLEEMADRYDMVGSQNNPRQDDIATLRDLKYDLRMAGSLEEKNRALDRLNKFANETRKRWDATGEAEAFKEQEIRIAEEESKNKAR